MADIKIGQAHLCLTRMSGIVVRGTCDGPAWHLFDTNDEDSVPIAYCPWCGDKLDGQKNIHGLTLDDIKETIAYQVSDCPHGCAADMDLVKLHKKLINVEAV